MSRHIVTEDATAGSTLLAKSYIVAAMTTTTDDDRDPRYVQIADDIRLQIESGGLRAGDQIPSLASLARTYGVSEGSVRAAVRHLREQGLISTTQGRQPVVRGTKQRTRYRDTDAIAEKRNVLLAAADRAQDGALERMTGRSLGEGDASVAATYTRVQADASLPEWPLGADLLRREYHTTDRATGQLLLWSVSWLPLRLIDSNPDLLDQDSEPWPGGTQSQLWTVGLEVMRTETVVTARLPSAREAAQWGMAIGDPLLVTRGRAIDQHGRYVAVGMATHPSDRAELEFVLDLPPMEQ